MLDLRWVFSAMKNAWNSDFDLFIIPQNFDIDLYTSVSPK